MVAPLVVVTGFGPFLDVAENPSGKVAMLLAEDPPPGIEVRGFELPVSFANSPRALAASLAGLGQRPDLLLGLGVHRGNNFRVERRARCVLDSHKPDDEGVFASALAPLGDRDLETPFDLSRLSTALESPHLEPTQYSEEAGGYVCERTYHALLSQSEHEGVPALFIHVPKEEFLSVEEQARHMRAVILELIDAS